MATPNTSTGAVLALIGDPALREDVSRVAAAAGVNLVHVDDPSGRKAWTAAAAVLLDAGAARRCAARVLPRRGRVILVGHSAPRPEDWQAAISVGAQQVVTLPAQDADLVAALSDAACRDDGGRGPAVAVVGARGGAGASVFAVALAQAAPAALLVEADPWSGGIDLVLGSEDLPGVRWPDLALQGGRLGYPALRDALPGRDRVSVLSSGRSGADIEAGPLAAVIDAGCRGGVTVVCDVPRRATEAAETALDTADLVVLLTPADVRSCAAAAALRPWVLACNPNAGVVVRGPSPGGLRAAEVARIVGLPLLAAMRPQAGVAEVLERGGLRLRSRSPLGSAARRVLTVLAQHPVEGTA
ncbi:secretion/DNA translocation related CpaE-like protein [Mycobacterium frederiksbergense]|uniref:Secretion/DNA translocation related CpaE-like protein n=1 Tax=Mycolicibacterium frederiksbergense TaxID=117567 RepID=A0ABT6L342_9MYCO|nr:septum site-determining protein Ssd [Mycolicibacterium frederiksbergense]MDH6196430.1 secretion/DNA translocation related CpaE-like protein [Mycolicibacterium frederiksbergense]